MNGLAAHQIEPPLDAFDALLQTIQPAIDAVKTLFNAGDANLQVGQVFDHAIDFLVDAAKIDQNDAVRFFSHNFQNVAVPALFRKEIR